MSDQSQSAPLIKMKQLDDASLKSGFFLGAKESPSLREKTKATREKMLLEKADVLPVLLGRKSPKVWVKLWVCCWVTAKFGDFGAFTVGAEGRHLRIQGKNEAEKRSQKIKQNWIWLQKGFS